jgi:cytochrome c-type biogenesis protein CcmE
MNPKRKQRLYLTLFLLLVAGGITALLIQISGENMNMFYPPSDVVSGKAPVGENLRAGGMVQDGSVLRSESDLGVTFVLTDHKGADFTVRYTGILPDLFREGQGILVEGQLNQAGVFEATEVLAKHDENYMPPELMELQGETPERKAAPMPGFPAPAQDSPKVTVGSAYDS